MDTFNIELFLSQGIKTVKVIPSAETDEDSGPIFSILIDGDISCEFRITDDLEWEVTSNEVLPEPDLKRILTEIQNRLYKQSA